MKKRFITKKIKKISLFDKLVYLFTIIICIIIIVNKNKDTINNMLNIIKEVSNPIAYIFLAFLILEVAFLTATPMLTIYLGISLPIKNKLKKNTTYNSSIDIKYYRDIFKGISPAEISILADMDVNTKKRCSSNDFIL